MHKLKINILSPHIFIYFLLCLFLLSWQHNTVASTISPLPAEKAFQFDLKINSFSTLTLTWKIAPQYYLYANKLTIKFPEKVAAKFTLPKASMKKNPVEAIYAGTLTIPVTLQKSSDVVQMQISYQGCSAEGFCYPPVNKIIMLNMQTLSDDTNAQQGVSLRTLLTDQNQIQQVLETEPLWAKLILFAMLGILLSFTPCVLPMVPILTGIIVGEAKDLNVKRSFFLSLTYVFGMAITYALAGLLAAMLGKSLQVWLQKPFIIVISASIFVLLAFSLFDLYDLRLPARIQNYLHRHHHRYQGGTYVGVFFLGVLSTLIVSPCVSAPLIGVLLYMGQSGDLLFGTLALFTMGLGMGLPLMLIGISAGRFVPKSGAWMNATKKILGLMMVAFAIWLFSRVFSAYITNILWATFIGICGLFIFLYLPRVVLNHRLLYRVSGILLVGLSLFLFFKIINPSQQLSVTKSQNQKEDFVIIKDLSQLQQQFSIAKTKRQPILIDFYADWCDSCVEMERNVFSQQAVRKTLNHYLLLRVNLSDNTEADQAMLAHFNVIAPPTILFFDSNGTEMNRERVVGEMNANEFIQRLKVVFAILCDKKEKC